MNNTFLKITSVVFSILFISNITNAADTTIEMLNKQGKESMVYSKKIVNVNVEFF